MEGKIPKSLGHFVRVWNCERVRVRVSNLNGDTASASGQIRQRLPERALLDLHTYEITAVATIAGDISGTAGVSLPVNYSMLQRVGWQIGGVALNYNNNQFGHSAHMVNLATRGIDCQNANALGWMPYSVNKPVVNTRSDGFICYNWFPNSLAETGTIHTGVFGSLDCEIQLAGNECLNATGSTAYTYSLANIRGYVDVVRPASDAYEKAINARLSGDGEVKLPVVSAPTFLQQISGNNSCNVSTRSLGSVLVGTKNQTYASAAAMTARFNDFLNFNSGLAKTATASQYLQIGSQNFPAYGNDGNRTLMLAELTRNWAGKNYTAYNFNLLFDSVPTAEGGQDQEYFLNKNHVVAYQLSAEGSAGDNQGLATGIDLQGQEATVRIVSNDYTTTDFFLICCLCDSVLSAKAGQAISFVQ